MSKASYINVGGVWKQAVMVWQKIGGVWVSGITPWIRESGTWYDCFDITNVSRTVNWQIQMDETGTDVGAYFSITENGLNKVYMENMQNSDPFTGSFTAYVGDTIRAVVQAGTYGQSDQIALNIYNGGTSIHFDTTVGYSSQIDYSFTLLADYTDLHVELTVNGQ